MSTIKSVVLSCAGTGSRLGLAQTKALINIEGKTLIAWQLEVFKDVEDLRIVVGFQANEVVKEVLLYRQDVVFVYNHSYFDTKTGMSLYLGGRDANEYIVAWDGDLLVHPEDVKTLLNLNEEYIAYSDKASTDAVFLDVNESGEVIKFSRENGEYEWTGPACIRKDHLLSNDGHVFDILNPYLPMKGIKVRAQDIDTYEDYKNAVKFLKSWYE